MTTPRCTIDLQTCLCSRVAGAARRRALLMRGAAAAAGIAFAAWASTGIAAQQPGAAQMLVSRMPAIDPCGTDVDRARAMGSAWRIAAAAAGDPISFEQSPPILTPDYTGTIALRRFTVAGDVESIRIRLATEGQDIQTWRRSAIDQMAGQTVSIFEPSWPAATLGAVLRGRTWGWDYPGIAWGELLRAGADERVGPDITLRIAPSSLPAVRVNRLADDVQYSANVVNLVIPGFGSRFVADENAFELTAVTQKFYQHFADSYDGIAVIPQDVFMSQYAGFHRSVRNDVRGIGKALVNQSAAYGSRSGRLHDVELFYRMSFAINGTSAHEIAHQWGAYIDWTRLAGLTRSGHQPSSHDPLWAEGETFIGSVLTAGRRVRRAGEKWVIERTPGVARFHPFTLYAMGLIEPEQVPEVTLFDEQGQFDPTNVASPDPGREVSGPTRTGTIYNVIGMLGPRSGPVHREWHRATVVVSRDRLLTQREMDYWTFFAQRLGDPNRTGLPAYIGTASFDEATYRRIDLQTDIRPLAADQIVEPLPVDFPSLGRRDWRDVIFDAPIPTRYRATERVRWSGVVNAERSDIETITVRLWKAGGSRDNAIVIEGSVSSAKSFVLETQFRDQHRGVYEMEVFLFWAGAPAQLSRVSISPITIE